MQTEPTKKSASVLILSLFSDDFSRVELQGMSKWRIDQGRKHATEAGKGQPIPEIPSSGSKIDPEKVDHFVEYIS